MKTIGFIGGGNMAEALIKGIIAAKIYAPENVFVSDIRTEQLELLAEKYGVTAVENNAELAGKVETLILSVKPQNMAAALESIKDTIAGNTLVISIAAGIKVAKIAAALGVAQMARLDHFIDDRRRIARWYTEEIQGIDGLRSPTLADPECASWFVYVVQLTDRFTSEDRNAIVQSLREQGIGCATYFPSIHLQPHLRELLGTKEGDFPRSEFLSDRGIALPFHGNLSPENVKYIVAVLTSLLSQRNQLNGRSI